MALSAFLRCLTVALLCVAWSAPFRGAAHAHTQNQAYGAQRLIRLSYNRPAIMVVVNGQGPFLFLIDTATSNTVLTPALRERLGIPAMPGPPVTVVTAAGSARSNYYLIAETAASGVIVEGIRGVVIDLPQEIGVAGALGADFLANFTVDLNLAAQTITLYPEATELRIPYLQRLRGRPTPHGFIVLNAKVDGMAVRAVFDSGAAHTVGNPRLAINANRYAGPILRPSENRVTDAARQKELAESHDFAKITLGPASWLDRRVLVSNMRVFEQIGLAREPALFIGMDLMAGRRVVIDYSTASLWLGP